MGKITIEQAKLMLRMYWNCARLRPPTESDKELVQRAIRMLSYIACLNYAACGLEDELRDAGLFKQETKRRVCIAQNLVREVHQTAYIMLYNANPVSGRQYNDAMDGSWSEIEKAVLLPPPERSYNIVLALCRLIESLNVALGGKYDFAPARKLYRIPAWLSCCDLEDHHIDVIIDMAVS